MKRRLKNGTDRNATSFPIPPRPMSSAWKRPKAVPRFDAAELQTLLDAARPDPGTVARSYLTTRNHSEIGDLVREIEVWIVEIRKAEMRLANKECLGPPPKVVPPHYEAQLHHFLAREGKHRQPAVWGRLNAMKRGAYRAFFAQEPVGLYIFGRARDIAGIRNSLPGRALTPYATPREDLAGMCLYYAHIKNQHCARKLERVLAADGINFQDAEDLASAFQMGDNYARIGRPREVQMAGFRHRSVIIRREDMERRRAHCLAEDVELRKKRPGLSKTRRAELIRAKLGLTESTRTIRNYLK